MISSSVGFTQFEDPTQKTTDQDPQLQRAEEYIERAKEFYAQAEYESSIKEYQFAAAIYRKTNHPELYAICYNGVGNNYINLTRYKEAYNEFNRGLALFKEIARFQPEVKIDSAIIADAYEGLGRYYMNVNVDFEKALYYHQEALRLRLIAEVPKDRVALSYFFMGNCYRHFTVDSTDAEKAKIKNSLEQELAFYQRALAIQKQTVGEKHYQTADTYAAIGNYYNEVIQNFQKGFEYNLKALSIRQNVFRKGHPQIASSYLDIAIYYRILNMYDKEREYLEKALDIQLSSLGVEHADVAKSYYLLGNRNNASGDFEQALDYYERSLNIYLELFTENSVEVAKLYEKMALCYRGLQKHVKEFTFLEKALTITKKIYGKDHFKVGGVLMEIGTYYGNVQEYDSLLHYYQQAKDLWKAQLGEDHYFIAKAHDNLAKAHRLRNESEKEFYYLNEALARKVNVKDLGIRKIQLKEAQEMQTAFEEVEDDNILVGTELFKSYMNLANFYKRKKDYKLALIYVQNALAAVCESLTSGNDIYKNPTVKELSHNIDWLHALEQKGSLFLKLYESNKENKNLEFANNTYSQALTLIDTLRINFSSDGSKQQLTVRSIPVYEGAIETLHTLYKFSRNPKYLYQAFEVMEKSKGFVLLQALQGISARNYSGVPADLLAREEYLRRNLAYYSDFKNRDNNQGDNFDAAYFDTKKAYDSLITRIEKNYPRYYTLKYQNKVAQLKEVQQSLLNGNNLLLEYFVGDEHIYIFKVTADYQYFYKIPIPNEIERMVTNLRNALTDYQLIGKDPQLAYKNYVVASHSFYKTFVMQFLSGVDASVEQLIIIPDGWLSYIPFSVLLEDLPKNLDVVNYKDLNYLLKRFEINYNYSSTLLLQNLKTLKDKTNNGKCLGFAPSYSNSESLGANADLPWAEKELKAVQNTLNGQFYFGLTATKDQFKQQASEYAVIHLAMHGVVNIRNSEKSILVFAKENDASKAKDEFLYAYEIHNMNLNADLVVLSACETGFGKVVRGEGVLSLARAFMYAGVPSVVTTLWKVNDYTSATLMTYFYENLDQGMTKPEALRKAKLKYLTQSDQISGHPAFWASFITIGNPKSLNYGFPGWVWPVLGIGIALLLFFIFRLFWNRRRKKKKKADQEEAYYNPQSGVDI